MNSGQDILKCARTAEYFKNPFERSLVSEAIQYLQGNSFSSKKERKQLKHLPCLSKKSFDFQQNLFYTEIQEFLWGEKILNCSAAPFFLFSSHLKYFQGAFLKPVNTNKVLIFLC
jgi:hypothetical protein